MPVKIKVRAPTSSLPMAIRTQWQEQIRAVDSAYAEMHTRIGLPIPLTTITITDNYARDIVTATGNPNVDFRNDMGDEPAGGFHPASSTCKNAVIVVNAKRLPKDSGGTARTWRLWMVAHEYAHVLTRCAHLSTYTVLLDDAPGVAAFFQVVGLTASDEYRANMLAWRVACEITSVADCTALIQRISQNAANEVSVRIPNLAKAADRIFKDYGAERIDIYEAISRFVGPFTDVCGTVITAVTFLRLISMPLPDIDIWASEKDKQILRPMIDFTEMIAAENPLPPLEDFANVEQRIMAIGESTVRTVLAIWGFHDSGDS